MSKVRITLKASTLRKPLPLPLTAEDIKGRVITVNNTTNVYLINVY